MDLKKNRAELKQIQEISKKYSDGHIKAEEEYRNKEYYLCIYCKKKQLKETGEKPVCWDCDKKTTDSAIVLWNKLAADIAKDEKYLKCRNKSERESFLQETFGSLLRERPNPAPYRLLQLIHAKRSTHNKSKNDSGNEHAFHEKVRAILTKDGYTNLKNTNVRLNFKYFKSHTDIIAYKEGVLLIMECKIADSVGELYRCVGQMVVYKANLIVPKELKIHSWEAPGHEKTPPLKEVQFALGYPVELKEKLPVEFLLSLKKSQGIDVLFF